ncbi:GNAT family N-acetyltransferase [Mesorhizobium sp. LHD-90]|uniref:GNAT family N-acetyltransferase n=1 Tax=Mesorhizobium sp. LHD-90 TaxID=3071414 RepID=UPI0027DEE2E2|nr:GNAT family N-acetyltransferase [Mesorhizobium sp. LHD-90]MDQ6432761.1 GNAT family N-acetyltransferase [Mesorhizobium sp. LHD-90]
MSGDFALEAEIRVRHAIVADAVRLSRFAAAVFEEAFAGTYDPPDMHNYLREAFSPDVQAAEIADPAVSIFIADQCGEIAGYVEITDDPGGNEMELNRIYLDPGQRGTGLGQRLLQVALEECARRQRRRIWLGVWHRNERAIAFYRKHGFSVCGETGFEWGDGIENGLVMERRT